MSQSAAGMDVNKIESKRGMATSQYAQRVQAGGLLRLSGSIKGYRIKKQPAVTQVDPGEFPGLFNLRGAGVDHPAGVPVFAVISFWAEV